MTLTRFDKTAQLERLWEALECYREDFISGSKHDSEWDDLCTIMAWITEDIENAHQSGFRGQVLYRYYLTLKNLIALVLISFIRMF